MATENNTDASSTENADHSTEYRRLIELGIALSAELDHNKLMESILLAAKEFCNADAGTLYLMSNDNELGFQIIRNDSLGIALGGTTGKDIDFPAVKIFDENGEPNLNNVSAAAAVTRQTINIRDAYASNRYDFSGTKKFDERPLICGPRRGHNFYQSTNDVGVLFIKDPDVGVLC